MEIVQVRRGTGGDGDGGLCVERCHFSKAKREDAAEIVELVNSAFASADNGIASRAQPRFAGGLTELVDRTGDSERIKRVSFQSLSMPFGKSSG